MLQAFQTYQLKDEAAREVINLSIEVIHELRQLLIPPTKSLPTSPNVKKTPASAAGSVRVPAKRGQAIVSNRSVSVSGHPKVAQGMLSWGTWLMYSGNTEEAKVERSSYYRI